MSGALTDTSIVAGASGAGEAYTIDQSLRLNEADNPYLGRTPSSASNRKTWTYSCWFKNDTGSTSGQSPTLLYTDNFQLYVHEESNALMHLDYMFTKMERDYKQLHA